MSFRYVSFNCHNNLTNQVLLPPLNRWGWEISRKENNLLTLILSKIKRLSNLLKINNFRARSLKSCQSGISLGQHVTKQRSKTVMTDCVHWDTAHLGLTCRRWCKWWTPFRFKFAYLDPGRNAESCKLCYFHFASLRRMTTVNILQTVEKTWLH